MNLYSINGENLAQMVAYGASWLALDVDRINALNVFPVPDTSVKVCLDIRKHSVKASCS